MPQCKGGSNGVSAAPFPQTRHVRAQGQEVGRGFVGADRDGVPAGAEAGLREPGRDTFPGGVPRVRSADRTGSSGRRQSRTRGGLHECAAHEAISACADEPDDFYSFAPRGPGTDHCYHDDVTAIGYSHGYCAGAWISLSPARGTTPSTSLSSDGGDRGDRRSPAENREGDPQGLPS